jgi:PPOX class probable F420-dependent enzyme
MNKAQALEYLKENHRGVLATAKKDGRPQLSNIGYFYAEDGEIKISTTSDRVKARNIARNPQVSMVAQGDNWYQYLVVEGTATVSEEGQLAELRQVYEGIAGKPHPDWQEYDEAMLRDHRVIISIKIEKMYPLENA